MKVLAKFLRNSISAEFLKIREQRLFAWVLCSQNPQLCLFHYGGQFHIRNPKYSFDFSSAPGIFQIKVKFASRIMRGHKSGITKVLTKIQTVLTLLKTISRHANNHFQFDAVKRH